MLTDNRLKIILAIIVVAIIAVFSIAPIAQQPDDHNFADRHSLFNIANFFNVLSNLPFVIIGIATVVYWYATELDDHGDLRVYMLVQFLPVVLMPLILWLFDSTLNNDKYIWGVIGAYAVSKLMELFDARLYSAAGLLSGHSLKHLVAALGTLIFYWALRRRRSEK